MKFIFTLIFCVLFSSFCYSATQNYESYLSSALLTHVDPDSYISWGCVDFNYIELSRINAGQDGFIEFNIEPTEHVEVSLTIEGNDSARFGFIFKSTNVTTIQINGTEIILPLITYEYNDVFKVVKCGELILFYKNGDRIYEHCFTDLASNLVHTAHVSNAVNTRLTLVFESDDLDCSDMYMAHGTACSNANRRQ